MFCSKCGAKVKSGTKTCPECGSKIVNSQPSYIEHTMLWHKFLIYFVLWFGAAVNLANGIAYFYAAKSMSTMLINPVVNIHHMQILDVVMGVVLILQAAFAIYTRFQLAAFKAKAPWLLIAFYALGGIINFGFSVATSFITEGVTFYDEFVSLAVAAIMCVINYVYFKNRADLFIN